MKVEIIKDETSKEVNYPCLMIEDNTEAIVLFTKERVGTRLSCKVSSEGAVFYTGCDWHMNSFKPFHGSVNISND